MKNTWRIVTVSVLSFSLILGGCGGGSNDGSGGSQASGDGDTGDTGNTGNRPGSALAVSERSTENGNPSALANPHQLPGQRHASTPLYLHGRLVRGLDNLKGSCFINTALQLVAHDDVLRKRVLHAKAAPELHTFFARYDQADADLTRAHADLVAYIRKAGHMPPGAGFTEAVLALLGAGYTDMWLQELAAIVTHLGAGERHFNVSAVSNQLHRRFDTMPDNANMKHFVYYTGGHYLSYFRDGEGWIEVNDGSVKAVGTMAVAALANKRVSDATYSGIAFAAYR